MRWALVACTLVACGRIGFDPVGGGNDPTRDGGGSNENPLQDAGPMLSCSNYTTLEACRREIGCTAVICDDCPCSAPTMAGCIGRGDNQTIACTNLSCAGCCTNINDCSITEYCLMYDGPMLCGLCNPVDTEPTCVTDAECTDSTCTVVGCNCQATCEHVPCTTDFSCGEGEYCGVSGYCLPRACTGDSQCPADYSCNNSVCTRRTCTVNTECSNYCANDHCYSARGICQMSPN